MDFSFSEEQEAVRDLAGQIFADHAGSDLERAKAIEASPDGIDRDLWSELAKANLLGVALPEAQGGSELGLTALALVLQEQGRALAPVPAWATLVLGALPVARFGSDEQRQRLLPGVAAGSRFLTAALAEPGAAGPGALRTRAKADGDGFRLDGAFVAVPAAHLADRILVPAVADGGTGLFLLDPGTGGVSLERQTATTHEPVAGLGLEGARVEAADVLCPPGEGEPALRWLLDRALAGVCALQLGVVEEALRRTAEYTSTRQQFERPIGSFQGVSLRAADGYIDTECMRSTLWQALWLLEEERPASAEVEVAKWWASRGGHRIGYTAQHLHGGIGADIEYPIHRFFYWTKQLDLTLGSGAPTLVSLGQRIARGEAQGAA